MFVSLEKLRLRDLNCTIDLIKLSSDIAADNITASTPCIRSYIETAIVESQNEIEKEFCILDPFQSMISIYVNNPSDGSISRSINREFIENMYNINLKGLHNLYTFEYLWNIYEQFKEHYPNCGYKEDLEVLQTFTNTLPENSLLRYMAKRSLLNSLVRSLHFNDRLDTINLIIKEIESASPEVLKCYENTSGHVYFTDFTWKETKKVRE